MPRDTLQFIIYPESKEQLETLKAKAKRVGFKTLGQYLIFVGLNAKIEVKVEAKK